MPSVSVRVRLSPIRMYSVWDHIDTERKFRASDPLHNNSLTTSHACQAKQEPLPVSGFAEARIDDINHSTNPLCHFIFVSQRPRAVGKYLVSLLFFIFHED